MGLNPNMLYLSQFCINLVVADTGMDKWLGGNLFLCLVALTSRILAEARSLLQWDFWLFASTDVLFSNRSFFTLSFQEFLSVTRS